MNKIMFSLALALCFSATGQVIIYKQTVTGSRTGNGETLRFSRTGYLILDAKTAKCAQINVATSPKVFSVKQWDDYEAAYVQGAKGKESYSLFRQSSYADANGDTRMETEVLSGAAVPLAIGAGSPFLYPRAMELTSRSWYYLASKPCSEEASGKLTFEQKSTKQANLAKESLAETVSRICASLIAQGYADEKNPVRVDYRRVD